MLILSLLFKHSFMKYTKQDFLDLSNELNLGMTDSDFNTYDTHCYSFFLKYLLLLCVEGIDSYKDVDELSYENCIELFNNRKCKRKISKILICEAPPPSFTNYFYNPKSSWNSTSGKPGKGQAYTTAVFNALFPGWAFSSKVEFLEECAKSGFLLLDLFPLPVNFSTLRRKKGFNSLCISQFMVKVLAFLGDKQCCIDLDSPLGFAFGLKSSGEAILRDASAVAAFNTWQAGAGIILNPPIPIGALRPYAHPDESVYHRVCARRFVLFPISALLRTSGIL